MNIVERKIAPREGVEVFVNEGGNISIKQTGEGFHGDEPMVVVVHPDDVPRLIQFLQEAVVEAHETELEELEIT